MLRRYFRFSQSGAFGRQNTLLSFQNLMDSWSAVRFVTLNFDLRLTLFLTRSV
jgi:hypothetical protein